MTSTLTSTTRMLLVVAAMVAAMLAFGIGGAQAAHCTDAGGAGNSDFASHVKANAGNNGHNEGSHKGWSSCEENSVNYAP